MNRALQGKRLTKTDFRVPSIATADLSGKVVLEVVPRGKHMLTRIDNGLTLHTHFKMDGTWHIYRPGQRWRGGKPHEVRVVLETDDRVAVGFRLPVVELLPTVEEDKVVGHLGPDVLSSEWNPGVAAKNVSASEASIFEALHDQRNVAGLGNLYCNESLFRAGVNPWAGARSIDDLPALLEIGRKLMTANLKGWHQSTTGDT
ncbi:MAG TPA: DNA-formamidopyrimidine glycosylase family protein, partial [Actinomycetota bacterium]|nr:DNA-formamidopyrimidine glycosylase family protein [Actinomycetota bacterium]